MSGPIIVEEGNLVGTIKVDGNLFGCISSEVALRGSLSMPVGYKDYEGPYTVVPKVSPQSLNTSDRHLANDVTVEAIPYYEVSNQQNGKTIIIGGR